MATKLPIAQKRLFQNIFICKNCNKKVRTQAARVASKKAKCPRCKSNALRPIRKK